MTNTHTHTHTYSIVVAQSVQRADDVLADELMTNEVALFFVSPEHEVLLQEYQSIDAAGILSG
jgi:hypothetical protein